MLEINLAVIGALSIVLGLASRPLRELPLSEPLVATACGALLGPAVAGLLAIPARQEAEVLATAAELVLAVSLMAVALRFPVASLRPHLRALVLLITAGLVAMALVPAGLALLLLGMPVAQALLLGAVLAPTDPVLASGIVTGGPAERDLPERMRVLLSVESGANDGLAFALVALAAALVTGGSVATEAVGSFVRFGVGVTVGLVAGLVIGRLLTYSEKHHDIEHSAFLVLTVGLAALTLGAAESLGGQGLIAVFVAGLAYGHEISRRERKEEWEVQEAVNRFLVLPVFVLFGVALPWSAWAALPPAAFAFAVAVLLLRRPPVLLAGMRPLAVPPAEATFMGWFGPVGVAALFYLAEGVTLGHVDDQLWAVGSLVIVLSTVAHGLTGSPGRKLFARHAGSG